MNFMELEKNYNPKLVEEKIYKMWEGSGYFNPDNLKTNKSKIKSYCIIMPPPNANGSLHLGHAVFATLQDIMIRFARMQGKKTLWLPGADHAGFETQVVFDKKLDKEGRNRFAMKREELWQEIWDFTQENKKIMGNQLRKLGASCDWSREKFTLDPDVINQVYETFEQLYKDGLAYRDIRVVNWCLKHKTALSDLETKYAEKIDTLYFIKYGPLTVATVRPETKFGDTALAVNPNDKRYKKYIGQIIEAEGVLGKLKFKVIADEAIDAKFGTGVVKVTPAHDQIDFEIWQRHKNEIEGPKTIIDENGRLIGEVGEFKGLKTAEARQKIAEAMQKIGILEKTDTNYKHQVATCYKCNSILEPIPKPQWFIKMKPLTEKAIKAVQKGEIKFYPERAKKVYFHWLKNIRDWNISRQIIWGIRIPAWYCEKKQNGKCKKQNGIFISTKPVEKCPYCGADEIKQDPDVFDTWFSSGQWPFITLGYPKNKNFKEFYPTDVMETGYDILFFWVARMIMLSLYRVHKIPFRNVYLHGLVRDKDRQKMSKSKGNAIDPLGMAEIYGTDAIRMALVVGNTAGNDIIISEDKIRGYRNFATKIWNASRFILMNYSPEFGIEKPKFSANDKKDITELKNIKKKIAKLINQFKFHQAAETLYHYFWHTFADKIIENSKKRLQGNNKDRKEAYQLLETIMKECLKMLHPFMPFITEEIWEKMGEKKLLMIERW